MILNYFPEPKYKIIKKEFLFMNGWMGRILHVNLTTAKITQLETEPYAKKYLGGRGIGAALYWEYVKPEIKAFDPENYLIFMTGPIVGTGAQGSTLLSVVGKSPATVPEGFCYGSFTGFVGAELKKAGFDGLLVTGKADHPVYLFIEDGQAELRDASHLWGQNGYQTGESLDQAHGGKTRFIAIGVAGENLVRTAVALASHDCTVSAGFGAVMGAKKLKAIIVRGSAKIQAADPEKLQELNKHITKINKRIRLVIAPNIEHTKYARLLECIGKGRCYLCGQECVAGMYRYGGKLEGHRKCQSVEYYLPWAYRDDQTDEQIAKTLWVAPLMANDYGFESWEMTSILDWLSDCYKTGILTEAETGLPLSKMGTLEFLEILLHAIAYREGFGDKLAEGLVRAGDLVKPEAKAMFRPSVAPIDHYYLSNPRAYIIMALFYPTEPRVHHLNYHEIAFVHIAWSAEMFKPGSTGVDYTALKKIARIFWKSEEAADFTGYAGQAKAAVTIQNRTYLKEMMGLCDWVYPLTYSFVTPDHLGDPEIEGKLYNAVTGGDPADLKTYSERCYNLFRLIMLREGRRSPEADYPHDYLFTEPLPGAPGHPAIVPGPDGKTVDMTGNKLDRTKYEAMLREFYRLRGWDEVTGIPKTETLAQLAIPDPVKF
jgi:aldehyde:ferredoxin oxidoreductase